MGIAESREQVKEALVRFVEAVEAADEERDEAEKTAQKLLEEREGYLRTFRDVTYSGDTWDMLCSVFDEDEKDQRAVARARRDNAIEDAKRRFREEWKAIEAS